MRDGLPVRALSDDELLTADLYLPDGPGPFPAVVLIHGGAFTAGHRDDAAMRAWGQRLAAEGFAAWSIDMRLVPDSPKGAPVFPEALDDARCAVGVLRSQAAAWSIDPEQIYVLGGSAGGWFASMLALDSAPSSCVEAAGTSTAVQGAVVYFGISDWTALLTGPARVGPTAHAVPSEVAFLGTDCATSWEAAGPCAEASPVTWLDAGDPPLFALHSADDPAIPVDQSRRLVAAAREAGVDVTYLEVDGMRHGWHAAFKKPAAAEAARAVLDALRGWADRAAVAEPTDSVIPGAASGAP